MTNINNFNYIIFHKGCIDGFAGFFVAIMKIKKITKIFIYEDVPSTQKIPPNIDGKNILIIDVAYNKSILNTIFKNANKVVFIDHHETIRDDVKMLYKKYDKNTIIYDESKCGATLTWSYFFGDKYEIPLFLKYIEDQDTGRWIYPKTKSFIIALKTYHTLNIKSIKQWYNLFDDDYVNKLCKKGKYMKQYNDYLIKTNIKRHSIQYFPSEKIYNMNPDIFNKIGQYKVAVWCGHGSPTITELSVVALDNIDCDFCIFWVYNIENKKYILSMRSKSVDIGEICKIFGGGGHKFAAACSIKDISTIDELFDNQY